MLAGRAGVELDSEDATGHLRRATELAPDHAAAWHHFGEALAADGDTGEAEAAFRRAVELDPDDQVALSHLGHTSLAAGRNDEGVGLLAQAADIGGGASTASISLVDMYRSFGQFDGGARPGPADRLRAPRTTCSHGSTWPSSASPSASSTNPRAAFDRLRELDDVPGHEAYPLHGMIDVEIGRERWPAVRELVAQLAAIDPHGLSTDLAAFPREQLGDAPRTTARRRPAPRWSRRSRASLADYRSMLVDDRRLTRRRSDWLISPQPALAPSRPSGSAAPTARRSSTTSGSSATSACARSATTTSACGSANGSASCSTPTASRSSSGDLEPLDALSFRDTKPYTDRIKDAQRKTGMKSGALYGTGTIDGLPDRRGGDRLRVHRRQHERRGGRGDHPGRRATRSRRARRCW